MWNAAWDFITVNGARKGREGQDNALSPTRQAKEGKDIPSPPRQDNALSPTRQAKEGKGRIYQANPARHYQANPAAFKGSITARKAKLRKTRLLISSTY